MSRWRFNAMIACTALVTGLPLVHRNAADFEAVRTLFKTVDPKHKLAPGARWRPTRLAADYKIVARFIKL